MIKVSSSLRLPTELTGRTRSEACLSRSTRRSSWKRCLALDKGTTTGTSICAHRRRMLMSSDVLVLFAYIVGYGVLLVGAVVYLLRERR